MTAEEPETDKNQPENVELMQPPSFCSRRVYITTGVGSDLHLVVCVGSGDSSVVRASDS